MKNYNDIIIEFKDGNADSRIDLYLLHRNLRPEFDQIETEESEKMKTGIADSQQLVIKSGNAIEHQPLLVRMKSWCLSLLS